MTFKDLLHKNRAQYMALLARTQRGATEEVLSLIDDTLSTFIEHKGEDIELDFYGTFTKQ